MKQRYTLQTLALRLRLAKNIWLFAKGPSFNQDFPWLEAMQPEDIRIGVSQAVERIPGPLCCLMYDKRVQELIRHEFSDIIYNEIMPGMDVPHSSGEFALAFIGTLAPGAVITTVGMDAGFVEYDESKPYGFDYIKISDLKERELEKQRAICAEVGRYCKLAIEKYNLKITRYTESC